MAFGFFKKKEKAQMMCQIEFCVSNMAQGSADAYDEMLTRTDVNVEAFGCTSNCELCVEQLFAVVNGEVVTAEDAGNLVASIEKEIKNNPLT